MLLAREVKMIDRPLAFELVVRRFLGRSKASHIANQEQDEKIRKTWLKRVAAKIAREIDEVETFEEHRVQLHHFVGEFDQALSGKKTDPWYAVYSLLGLSAALLGRVSASGARLCLPSYTLSMDEYYTRLIRKGGDPLQSHTDRHNIVETRREVIEFLKGKGLNDNQVGLVLNISVHQIRKLRL